MRSALVLFIALTGCRASVQADAPATKDDRTEDRATAMPEGLRCKAASDCAPEVTCYWGTPSCVATASAAEPVKCGDDADPPRPEITCACNDGQCTAVEK